MTTITLRCSFCGENFERDKTDHNRRMSKLPESDNYFCNLSHSAKYRNKHRKTQSVPLPQYGNTYRQKYPVEVAWYVRRCAADHRFGIMENDQRMPFAERILKKWEEQEHRCCITGVPLKLRRGAKGESGTDNPFEIASLDRIDNDKPYLVDNVQWVSLAMNRARSNLPIEDFLEYYTKIDLSTFKCQL